MKDDRGDEATSAELGLRELCVDWTTGGIDERDDDPVVAPPKLGDSRVDCATEEISDRDDERVVVELEMGDSRVSCLVEEVEKCDDEAATVELKLGMPSDGESETLLLDQLVREEDNCSDGPIVVRLAMVVTTGEALVVVLLLLLRVEPADGVPAAVGGNFEVPESPGVLPEKTPVLPITRVDELGPEESWEPEVDRVEDAAMLGSACRPGHSDTG
ncbi:hypothetical protein INS49_005437 [Diaporthe citri]|uniref:uncharacterized protein n=1 Tax=Diaporthe citri TaxID=83186 RepID=UPI001C802E1D|nr:uncharacterized protein INS49_005437 [Diaporthe citri]KAG6353728.1 hypothetical protein INS49_005437 [Diaporthe citri]